MRVIIHTQFTSMALSTFLLAAVVLSAYALYKYWAISRRQRIPTGLKSLPGPKGMAPTPLVDTYDRLNQWTLEFIPVQKLIDVL